MKLCCSLIYCSIISWWSMWLFISAILTISADISFHAFSDETILVDKQWPGRHWSGLLTRRTLCSTKVMPNFSHVAKLREILSQRISSQIVLYNHRNREKIYLHVAVCLAASRSCDVFHSLKNGQLSDAKTGMNQCNRATQDGIWICRLRRVKRTYRAAGPQDIVNEGELRS